MKHHRFSIQINDPCTQNWDEMSKNEQDRFCSHCSKVVKDFTTMSENQISAYFKTHIKTVCGRISLQQLEQTYPISLQKTAWYMNRFLHFAMSGLLTLKTGAGIAQNNPNNVEQISFNRKSEDNESSSIKGNTKKFIDGKTIGNNGSALDNTFVMIEETGQSFKTDSTGKFRFELPINFSGKQLTLTFSHNGYEIENRTFNIGQLPIKRLIIYMHQHHIKMGKMMYKPKD